MGLRSQSALRGPAAIESPIAKLPSAPGAFATHSPAPAGRGHSFSDANVQLTGSRQGASAAAPPLNNGYVQQFKSELFSDHIDRPTTEQLAQVMQSFGPEQLPSLNALADAFCVCDHWFSEVPGPTQPNRLFMHAATSSGLTYNNWSQKFDGKTIYNNLQEAGLSWGVYWTDDNEVAEFTRVASEADNFKDYANHFVADAQAGRLPNYSFIEPQFNSTHDQSANSQHPPGDARYGDHLVADVYEALRSNEAAWAKTMLVVTYDEHGGFYEHVVPPAKGVPNPDGLDAPQPGAPSWVTPFSFDRLGMRVPAVLASPWIDPGVESRQRQHTSVLSTVKRLFGLAGFLTKRDASATPFDDLLQKRSVPRTDTPRTLPRAPLPPTSSDPEDPANPGNHKLDATQQELVQGVHALTASAVSAAEPVATRQHEAAQQMKRRLTA